MTRRQPLLVLVAVGMVPLTLICLLGLGLDPRELAGAPLWLKPLKFSLSVMIYCATLAAMLTSLPHSRAATWIGHLSAALLTLEMVCIVSQAARGTSSHYNVGHPYDALLFSLMGIGIATVMLLALGASILWWLHAGNDALRLAVALGLAVTVLGGFLGALMLAPSPEQREALDRGERPTLIGHHTVGAPDGGPGMPLTNWSVTHGDLRVAHFVGLHGMQVIPLLAYFLLPGARRPRALAALLALSYAGLVGLILVQALRAQPLLHPDLLTLTGLALWAALSLAATRWARGTVEPVGVPV